MAEVFFPPRGLQSIIYTYLWSEKFSMATENFEMPSFYFILKVQKVCLYSSQSWHIIGYDLIFIALDIFIQSLLYDPCSLPIRWIRSDLQAKYTIPPLEEI